MTELTVVIPTFNRAEKLRRCLECLEGQSAPIRSFEVIVVDDGSSDGTAALLRGYDGPLRLRTLSQSNSGPSAARNRGIEVAEAPICLFIDDDILADPALVAEHIRAQRAGAVVAIGDLRIRMRRPRGGLERYFADWWKAHYARLASGERSADFWSCYSGNMSAPTTALREARGFDEELGRSEDVELGYRLQRGGTPIEFVASAGAEQDYAKGFRDIVADFEAAGRAAFPLARRHPDLLRYEPLGDFDQGGARGLLLRRLLLALRAPVWPFRPLDALLARRPSPRVYRYLQLYCFWRGLWRDASSRGVRKRLSRPPVILMYHAVGLPGEAATRFVIPAGRLRRQLLWLRLTRRPVIGLDQLVEMRSRNELPPPRAVLLTFDDAYADVAEVAAPLLQQRALPWTVFVVSGAVGRHNDWTSSGPLAGRRLMSAAQLRTLYERGVTIGAHSVTHPRLADLDAPGSARELRDSRDWIEAELGASPGHFAYPYGNSSPRVREQAEAAGFVSGLGIEPGLSGPAVSRWNLRRMEVWGTRSLPRFIVDLWLGRPLGEPRAERRR